MTFTVETPLRIGSLFTGYSGLDIAVKTVFPNSTLSWVCDNNEAASQLLSYHYPTIPNLGDITLVDWSTVPLVDMVTAGFPCQDMSIASTSVRGADRREGLQGKRSGLWFEVVKALQILRPKYALLENVRGIFTAKGVSPMESFLCHMARDSEQSYGMRAFETVLSTLADIGFNAEWITLPAAAVGAPSKRERVFILAYEAIANASS